jgi:hypothetical protein
MLALLDFYFIFCLLLISSNRYQDIFDKKNFIVILSNIFIKAL